MKKGIWLPILMLAALSFRFASAGVILVPEQRSTIQVGIDNALDGDTVSVWGPPPGQPSVPPWTYYENVNFGGRCVFLVNRSFLPGGLTGYDSSWNHVIINGQQSGTTVMLDAQASQRSVVKGFTITGGSNSIYYGGGIFCQNRTAVIEKNYIHGNFSAHGGGGVAYVHYSLGYDTVYVRGCRIEANTTGLPGQSPCDGGGIYVSDLHAPSVFVRMQGNEILSNSATGKGGGVFMSEPASLEDPPAAGPVLLEDNVVSGNQTPGGVTKPGGGIYSENCTGWAFRNQITDNSPDGIAMAATSVFHDPLRLGQASDPGFNFLKGNALGNDTCDYRLCGGFGLNASAIGNYWGTLDAATVWSHIENSQSGVIEIWLDPVAASGKWFSVNQNSHCETGVLVTGDLQIEAGAKLDIDPGKELALSSVPDYNSLPGGDPSLCELNVFGIVNALGGEGDSVWFHPTPTSLPESHWYGIRVRPQGTVNLAHSIVERAYCGVDAYEGASVTANYCRISNNMSNGVRLTGANGQVSYCSVTDNGAIGAEFTQVGTPVQVSVDHSQFHRNAFAGVKAKGCSGGAGSGIVHNIVESGFDPTHAAPYGIMAVQCDGSLAIGQNVVLGCSQAGLYEERSSSPSTGDVLDGNSHGATGLSCVLSSTPSVRGDVITRNMRGVFVDGTSLPNLGNATSHGENSILTDNQQYWVVNLNSSHQVPAQYNWWGVAPPSPPSRFLGPVLYAPWLTEPPQGDGGQSAGSTEAGAQDLEFTTPSVAMGGVRLCWQLPEQTRTKVAVYDNSGRMVRVLADGLQQRGTHAAQWDCLDTHGQRVSSGVYFCVLEAAGKRLGRKVVLTGR